MTRQKIFQKPTDTHLERLYYELGKIGARSVGRKSEWPYVIDRTETLLSLAAAWTRFDPRLMEILVQFGLTTWRRWLPQAIREDFSKIETPQTWGVVAGFIRAAAPSDMELHYFWDYVVRGLKPVADQYYFFELYSIGGNFSERVTRESLRQYRDWGFLGNERIIINPQTKEEIGDWRQPERVNILKRLFKKESQLAVADYLQEIQQSISRQQAIQDLRKLGARPSGSGRGGVWSLPKKL